MSLDTSWDIDKYRDIHECEDHWQLRRAFMERWKQDYTEERLVCLARVFANIEFMGCSYPPEVMAEVSRMSKEVASSYRTIKKTKLQRTFVSASDAAEDRAKGVKREGGIIVSGPPQKSTKIAFVPQGTVNVESCDSEKEADPETTVIKNLEDDLTEPKEIVKPLSDIKLVDYMSELSRIACLDVRKFRESMFNTSYGKMVLVVRPWISKMCNITASCQTCGIPITQKYINGVFALTINNNLVAQATGDSKADAKSVVEAMAWNRLIEQMVVVVVKQQFIAQNDGPISINQIGRQTQPEFGKPVENSVATKMMKLMGWKGGGLGTDAQGIEEPIKPNFQMVARCGLGAVGSDIRQLRRAAGDLMRRYQHSDHHADLVFASDFSKEERAALHKLAGGMGLATKSYGSDSDRFLVVKKKLNPFGMVKTAIDCGGSTQKYQVFIPAALGNK